MKARWTWIVFFSYTVIQLIYVIGFPLPLVSDSLTYFNYAQQAIGENTYYPNPSSVYSTWLVAPVYINYLIGLLKIHNSLSIVLLFNILLNNLQLILLFLVVRKIVNQSTAYAAGLLYILYLNNLGMVLMNLTEFMFGIFILASIYFYIAQPKLLNHILAGIFLGLAVGVRPTGMGLLITYIAIYVFDAFHKQYHHKKLIAILSGLVVFIICMGLLSYRNIQRFEYTSTTGPANLIMSANPKATGVYSDYFTKTDSLYKTKTTYYDRNEYLMSRSKEYIKENPFDWLALIPRKIYSTFIFDGWVIDKLLHKEGVDLNKYLKNTNNFRQEFNKESLSLRVGFWLLNAWQYIIYSIILVLFIVKTFTIRKWYHNKHELLLFAFIVITIGLTILSSVGNARYKYTVLIIAIALGSSTLVELMNKILTRFGFSKKFDRQSGDSK